MTEPKTEGTSPEQSEEVPSRSIVDVPRKIADKYFEMDQSAPAIVPAGFFAWVSDGYLLYRDFYEKATQLEEGIVDFTLHNDMVDEFEKAAKAVYDYRRGM